jgi:N-acetylmuramoyl-L-alanine amidase
MPVSRNAAHPVLRWSLPILLGIGIQAALLGPLPAPSAAQLSAPSAEPRRVVAIDPGHGGREPGAVYRGASGRVELVEKDANLAISLYLAEELRSAGYEAVLTRTADTEVNVPPTDRNGDGRIDNDDDLQARVDVANEARASLVISVHNNGASSSRTRGTSTWYSSAHPLGARGRALAELAQAELLGGLRAAGYADVVDQGANDDPPLRKPYGHLFVVGPQTPRVARVSEMPGVIGESLYITSDVESRLLASEEIQRAIAAAYTRAVQQFLSALAD